MTDNEITHAVIGAAIEVHRLLGPALLDSTYKNCMIHELKTRNLRVECERPVPVVYKGMKLECGYRLDLLVEGDVIVELKSVEAIAPVHEATLLTYLRHSGHRLGLLINFNVAVLKEGIRRFIV